MPCLVGSENVLKARLEAQNNSTGNSINMQINLEEERNMSAEIKDILI